MKSSKKSPGTSSPPTPGYSGKPLAAKIGVKPGMRIVARHAPDEFEAWLGPLPEDTTLTARITSGADIAIVFATQFSVLKKELPKLIDHAGDRGMIWIAWPKKASKVPTDLDENIVREFGLTTGWVDVKVCAISEVWSGHKFLRRRAT
ncbi:MAG: hypothetical protein K1X57_15920 [Gemmataceae bacterium]|nr:hypothetical protein [Gemmataceae bacterium]